MSTQEHLDWLLYLLADNPEGWRLHCRRRARELAKEDPEHADLPRLLDERLASGARAVPSGLSLTPSTQRRPAEPELVAKNATEPTTGR